MFNLLFISDNPKVEYAKGVLQPLLKVIIDVVTDFDHGLKDVFEKRPATVCIQDQIGGVTGESVARHIQMLLGTSAPMFILLHTGNGKATAIKGLYEHSIDLSQSDDAVATEIISTLKLLFGNQWEKIYIPPKLSPASIRLSMTVPEASREVADKLVDDFLSDLETSSYDQPSVMSAPDAGAGASSGTTQFSTSLKPEVANGTFEPEMAQTIDDNLAELLLMKENTVRVDGRPVVVKSSVNSGLEADFLESPKIVTSVEEPPVAVITEPLAPTETSSSMTPCVKPVGSTHGKKEVKSSAAVTLQQTSPADEFRISQKTSPAEEALTDDLFLAFEENYCSESLLLRRSVVFLFFCVLCAAGGWYLIKHNPQQFVWFKKLFMPANVAIQKPATVPAEHPVPKSTPLPVPQVANYPPLPAFIPKDGHDTSFALKNPGWDRYVAKTNEFRIFSASGRILAVQVLAIKDATIPESILKSVLQELTGVTSYKITSRSMKAGVRVENGKIQDKGEVVIYRKNGDVKALVVSVN